MLELTTKEIAILDSDSPIMNHLYNFNDTLYITDAVRDITIDMVTYQNQEKVGMHITATAMPTRGERINSSTFEIQIADTDAFRWKKYFDIPEYRKTQITVYAFFSDRNGTGITAPRQIFKGTLSAVGQLFNDSVGRLVTLEVSDQLQQLDGEYSAITTKDNQRSRDPLDSSFDFTGVLRELSWGKR